MDQHVDSVDTPRSSFTGSAHELRAPRSVDEINHDMPIIQFIGRKAKLLEIAAPAIRAGVAISSRGHPDRGGVDYQLYSGNIGLGHDFGLQGAGLGEVGGQLFSALRVPIPHRNARCTGACNRVERSPSGSTGPQHQRIHPLGGAGHPFTQRRQNTLYICVVRDDRVVAERQRVGSANLPRHVAGNVCQLERAQLMWNSDVRAYKASSRK